MISNNRGDTSIRVLHVDDEDNQLVMTKIFIERNNPNINLTSANTITEAFNLIESSEFDCIISDYKMLEMTGVEFVEKIRESSNIPFILYTGQGSEEVASAAFLAGVDDYLRKEIEPSHYQVLTNRVRKVVEQYRAEISLEESENRFRGIAERSFEAIVILDINGYVTYASPAVEKLTGNTPDSFIGKFFMDFISFPSMEEVPS